jgi:flagellar biosynthesis/type III secretory pathway M-ring protein FliF/YscJ
VLGAAGGAAGAGDKGAGAAGAEATPKDPQELMREKAQKLALENPDRAAHLIRAWLSADLDAQKEAARNA